MRYLLLSLICMLNVFSAHAYVPRRSAEILRARFLELYQQGIMEHKKSKELILNDLNTQYLKDIEIVDSPEDKEFLVKLGGDILNDLADDRMENFLSLEVNSMNKSMVAGPAFRPGVNDAYKTSYKNNEEVLESLVSGGDNADWYSKAHVEYETINSTQKLAAVMVKLKRDFKILGVGVETEAASEFSWNREVEFDIEIAADGLHPIMRTETNATGTDTHFDFLDRDRNGKVLLLNGKPKRRHIYFDCRMTMKYYTEFEGEGTILGAGGLPFTVKVSAGVKAGMKKAHGHDESYFSRRIVIPETIGDKLTNLATITHMCEEEFPKTKREGRTLLDQLDAEVRAVVANAKFHQPRSTCGRDTDCNAWMINDMKSPKNTIAKCVEVNKDQKIMGCALYSTWGGACPLYDGKGKRVSKGVSENTCSSELVCTKTSGTSFSSGINFRYLFATGVCQKK